MNPDPNQPSSTPPTTDAPLQFEKAEFKEAVGINCAMCKAPVSGEFYQINGHNVCPACKQKAESQSSGSAVGSRFAIAFAAGLGAAAVGVFVWWAVRVLSGGAWGIVAVAVGWMVGYAVRWGARARGGVAYQLLAVVLTYCAIAAAEAQYFLPRHPDASDYVRAFVEGATAPFSGGAGNILWWIIIFIGLQQAWQMNREARLQISGPFSARQSSPPAAT
jgi:hypothetical protein